mmetsp:Transcript_26799/g.53473  ORF Transcript_26799/g.53473 Transcript_26799/m.53473 type:complete len:123 (+) Transcript_26799:1116-1484(+)
MAPGLDLDPVQEEISMIEIGGTTIPTMASAETMVGEGGEAVTVVTAEGEATAAMVEVGCAGTGSVEEDQTWIGADLIWTEVDQILWTEMTGDVEWIWTARRVDPAGELVAEGDTWDIRGAAG